MPFVERLLKKLFPSKASHRGGHRVKIVEELQRGTRFYSNYQTWLAQNGFTPIFSSLLQKYRSKILGVYNKTDFFIFESYASLGFYFTCSADYSISEYRYALELFKDRALAVGYRKANSQKRITEKEEKVETIERYYLKPTISYNENTKINQLYGNVMMELVLLDEDPIYLKVMIHAYSDRSFAPALNADRLITLLLESD